MKNLAIAILAIIFITGLSSCAKQDTIPTGGVDPNIKVNFSTDSLKARYDRNGGYPYLITDSLVISAVVVGDDSSGTFYKGLPIEDSTGGIMLMIDASYLYNKYPMGTRIFVHLKGLYVVQYKGVYEIVAILNTNGTYTGIPSSVTSQFITTGKWGLYVPPIMVGVSQLNASPNTYQSELIQLTNVQFAQGAIGVPYVNRGVNLRDCGGEDQIQVYTSSYADFANLLTPAGNGTFICVYSVYNSAPELLIRDLGDINLNGTPCP